MSHCSTPPAFSRQRRTRFSSSLLLFIAAPLAVSLGCGGSPAPSCTTHPDRYAVAIQEVFGQDKAAGEKCKADVKVERLAAVRAYSLALRRIDLRRCPPDFQEAFLKHRYAWEEVVPFLEKYEGFTGDLISLFELGSAIIDKYSLTTDKDREFDRIRKTITATYFEVEKIALRYGVQPER